MCVAFGNTCMNPSTGGAQPIECNQNNDCTANGMAGAACALQGASAMPSMPTGCTYFKVSSGSTKGIVCEMPDGGAAEDGGDAAAATGVPTCSGAGDIQICSSAADCPARKTCTPMKWSIFDVGFCM